MKHQNYNSQTKAAHLGRNTDLSSGFVNLPEYHGSTVLYESAEAFLRSHEERNIPNKVQYGRRGTPASFALEQTVCELEGGYGAITTSSGLSAITNALMTVLSAGDHILMTDTVYEPTRSFCDRVLTKFDIDCTYYDPMVGANIRQLVKPNTKVIFLESPGSLTFEVQDIPAITAVARELDIVTIIDNTWATPLYLNPFSLGVDISVHAATKYITGHSDAMLGIICSNEKYAATIRNSVFAYGECAGPNTIFLGLRGLRTMPTRLEQHYAAGMEIAEWLADRSEVQWVIHPAYIDSPGHEFWARDFTGASGLFAFLLDDDISQATTNAFLNALNLFGMGYSWGGFESLLIPVYPQRARTATTWEETGQLMRIHVGLESVKDLKADLEGGFKALLAHQSAA